MLAADICNFHIIDVFFHCKYYSFMCVVLKNDFTFPDSSVGN
jgi:hypothetical protein